MRGSGLTTSTRLRIAVAVVVVLVNMVHGSAVAVLPWVLLVLAADLAVGWVLVVGPLALRDQRIVGLALTLAGATVAGLALAAGVGALPLVIVPLFRAGEFWGRRGVLACGLAYLLAAAGAWALEPRVRAELAPSAILIWAALALSLGGLAAWSARLATSPGRSAAAAGEAAWLLGRLEVLANDLQGGFDPATSAEQLLDALPSVGAQVRAAVLIGSPGDRPVPLALRGSLRVPWPDPRDDVGVLGLAWREGRSGTAWDPVDHRNLFVVPLRDTSGRQIGVVVCDGTSTGSRSEQLDAVAEIVDRHGGLVGVALAFGMLRERAGIEERERLARQIHDGIAQELVALGFRLDRAKRAPESADVRAELGAAREEVSRILRDVRSHIGDLRLTVRPEGGLGAAITSQLQTFGAVTGAVVRLRLSESTFRLPAHVETGFYRIFLDFLAEARVAGSDAEVDVDLRTQAPDAELVMQHRGTTRLTVPALERHLPNSSGAIATVTHSPTGSRISVHLATIPDSAVNAVLHERLPQPS